MQKEDVSLIDSGEILDLKILHFDWLRVFWSISQGQDFVQIQDLCRNTVGNVYFHYRTN